GRGHGHRPGRADRHVALAGRAAGQGAAGHGGPGRRFPRGVRDRVTADAREAPIFRHSTEEPLDTGTRIECQWCRSQNMPGSQSCYTCGAPLDVRNLVSDSGWREAPRLRDMTEIHFGQSSCQVEGEIVPVAEIALAPGDWAYFEHHVMLWKDESV